MNPISDLNLILASGSPRRKRLLENLGLVFDVFVSYIDEAVSANVTPSEYVRMIAKRKADAVNGMVLEKADCKKTLIISADTTVVVDGAILGKPQNDEEAYVMLQKLQGREHKVFSAICMIETMSNQCLVDDLCTHVTMKPLCHEQIAAYIATREPMDKAGAYAIQGIGATLIFKIEGDYFNVVGLSLSLFSDMLTKIGYPLLAATCIQYR